MRTFREARRPFEESGLGSDAFPRPTISGTVACRLRAALADVVEMVDTQDLKS